MPLETPALPALTVRSATPADTAFIEQLVPRFVEFGPPAWHDSERLLDCFLEDIRQAMYHRPTGDTVLIAESNGIPRGFISLQVRWDPLSGAEHGHVSDLAVARDADGQGVASTLLAHAERWADAQHLPFLTLTVFASNTRARRLYARHGYHEDRLTLHKPLLPTSEHGDAPLAS